MAVRRISNLLDLLEHFGRTKRPASLSDIVEQLGWPRSSAHHLLSTLLERGYLYEIKPRRGFYPTQALRELAEDISSADPLPPEVHGLLHDIMVLTGETAMCAVSMDTFAVIIDAEQSLQDIRFVARIGTRVPIHATPSGRALLSQYKEADRARLLRKVSFVPYQQDTLLSADDVERDIASSLQRGFFESRSGFTQDVAAVAVPMTLGGRKLSISVGGPAYRFSLRMAEVGAIMKSSVDRFLGEFAGQD
jgi:DNA-binding IclR family transcriptional regulator